MKTQKEKATEHEESRDFFCLVSDAFRIFARRSSKVLGSAWAFASAILIIVIWALTGPMFHYSNTWQLIINTGTTIVTFLMGLSYSEYAESRCQSSAFETRRNNSSAERRSKSTHRSGKNFPTKNSPVLKNSLNRYEKKQRGTEATLAACQKPPRDERLAVAT